MAVWRVLALAIGSVVFFAWPQAQAAAASAYYVDCSAGKDSNSGTSASAPWRTVARANNANLTAGAKLLFKRGCTWSGTGLMARWSGTSSAPITIGAYGTGNPPLLQNAQDQLYVTGSWLIIDGLAARADPVTHDSQCDNAPAGRRTGFRLRPGAAHDVLRNLRASDLFIGIWIEEGSHDNQVLYNTLTNNRMKSDIWTSDAGSVGIALHGDDNEVAHNTISGSDSCSRFYGRDGSAIEIYGGQRNRIHHNRAINNHNFTELGNKRSSDNTYTYNVVTSTLATAHFLTTRGGKDSKYGPVYRTKAYNNTVFLSGSQSHAIQCGGGCGSSVLSLRDNIIWSAYEIGYADAAFDEGDNVYWTPGGVTRLYFPISSSSIKANPLWVSPSSGDFRLQSGSPALNQAARQSIDLGYTKDYAGTSLPQGGAVDMGAFERPTS